MRLLWLLPLLLLAQPAYPFGADAHEAIAEVASGMLTHKAKSSIQKILGNEDLPYISTWLDDVRNAKKHHVGPLKAKAFNAKFPSNLPVGTTTYADSSFFASKDDVVHAIGHAIEVLEGKMNDMTADQALCVLVHLVGDVHQPMHTISGYFDVTDTGQPKLISDPRKAAGKPNDRGGNQLFYTKTLELHAYWDTKMLQWIQRMQPSETLSQILAAESSAQKWLTPGDYHQWAIRWVEESAAEAAAAYKGIYFGHATLGPGDALDRIEISLPAGYMEEQAPRAKTQLAKAACHLAQLLNGIRMR